MARTFKRKESLTAVSEINVTPLIDLAFALLIIFMITTPLLEQSIEIDLPSQNQQNQGDAPEREVQVISIDPAGQIFWGKEAVSDLQLDELLSGLAAQPQPPVIHLRGDKQIRYQRVIDVINLIKKNKLSALNLDTRVE